MRSDLIPAFGVAVLVCLFSGLLLWNLAPAPRHIPADPAGRAQGEALPGTPFPKARTETAPDPADLALFFRRPPAKREPAVQQNPAAEQEPPPVPGRFKVLGTVTGQDGAARLYLKDLQGGRLSQIRLDGAEENGTAMLEAAAARYVIRIGGEKFAVSRSRP